MHLFTHLISLTQSFIRSFIQYWLRTHSPFVICYLQHVLCSLFLFFFSAWIIANFIFYYPFSLSYFISPVTWIEMSEAVYNHVKKCSMHPSAPLRGSTQKVISHNSLRRQFAGLYLSWRRVSSIQLYRPEFEWKNVLLNSNSANQKQLSMIKNRSSSLKTTRTYDKDGYVLRAGCLCFRNEDEQEACRHCVNYYAFSFSSLILLYTLYRFF